MVFDPESGTRIVIRLWFWSQSDKKASQLVDYLIDMEQFITKFSSQSKLERKQPLLNVRFAPGCEDVEGC